MGIHRNVIHPRFGNFILLGTVLVERRVTSYGQPLDYTPCLECKLCVAACPVGAITPDGDFDFSPARRTTTGSSWAASPTGCRQSPTARTPPTTVAGQRFGDRVDVAEPVVQAELQGGVLPGVCPAGEDVIGPYLDDRKGFMDLVLKPLQDKRETLYVLPDSEAKAHAEKRYPAQAGQGRRQRHPRPQ